MISNDYVYRPSRLLTGLFAGIAFVGISLFEVGALEFPQRAWANLLLGSYYVLGIGLGGAVLAACFYVTGASWSGVIRRVPESLTALLPWSALALLLVLIVRPTLYPWFNEPKLPGNDLSPFQRVWFDRYFFLARAFVYIALWLAFAFALVRRSRREDRTGAETSPGRNTAFSAAFLVVFAITCWLASTDWIMSLEPGWSSTIFGLYNFAGIFLSTIAAACVAVICLSGRGGYKGVVGKKQLYDLGTLLFSFSSFWMYIWFCQYMLIWYVNNPEETAYFRLRRQGAWQDLMLLSLALNWGVPFVVLLFRRAKESGAILFLVAASVLVGHWIDLYQMILPPLVGQVPVFSTWELKMEVGLPLAALGLSVFLVRLALARAPLVPKLAANEIAMA